jgi:hypothetical protein
MLSPKGLIKLKFCPTGNSNTLCLGSEQDQFALVFFLPLEPPLHKDLTLVPIVKDNAYKKHGLEKVLST